MTTGATNVTTGDVNVESKSESETGDQTVTQKQEQRQTVKTNVKGVDVSKHGKIAGAAHVAGPAAVHYAPVGVPITAKTGAGLLGSLGTLVGAAGVTFSLRRTW